MTKTIRAVIFDADGTLIDSEVPGMDILHQQALEEGLTFSREEAHQQFRGACMADIVGWIASQLTRKTSDFEADFTNKVRKLQVERFNQELAPMPGALELLSRLKVPYCIATNGPREKVELTLKLTGLRPFFGEQIYSAYDLGFFKPDPGLFLQAAAGLGEAAEYCAVVEDSLPGIEAGLNAGMQVFSLLSQHELPVLIAQRVTCITGLDELIRQWCDEIS